MGEKFSQKIIGLFFSFKGFGYYSYDYDEEEENGEDFEDAEDNEVTVVEGQNVLSLKAKTFWH